MPIILSEPLVIHISAISSSQVLHSLLVPHCFSLTYGSEMSPVFLSGGYSILHDPTRMLANEVHVLVV